MKKHKVRAVHDDDLFEFLDSIGLHQALDSGEIRCHVCGEQVTVDNLQAVLPLTNEIALVCSDAACVKRIEINS